MSSFHGPRAMIRRRTFRPLLSALRFRIPPFVMSMLRQTSMSSRSNEKASVFAKTLVEIRADFQHLRRWRRSVEQAQSYTFKAVITVIVTGFVGAYGSASRRRSANDLRTCRNT